MNKIILALVLTISTTSCGTKVCKVQPLPIPPPLPAEKILNQAELSCVSDETLEKIILLDKRRKTLRDIIESTQTK